jgi:hypothetical protein
MTGYIIGWCGQVLKTTNCGLNWYNQTLPVAADSFWGRSCFFTNAETGYLVGQPNNVSGYFSYIFKTTNSGEPSGIKPVSNEIPSKFSLYQNYPNPFNPITKIKFDLQKSEYTVLTIFDVLGREVAVLVSEQLKPGTYEVEWEGSNYPSGVYFCKIKASEFTDVKKMILVK